VSPSFACLLIFMVSVALAQKSSQAKSDREKAGLRGPVEAVLNEQTFSGADGQQFDMSTTTEYAPDGRILEQRSKNTDGSEWVVSYTYDSDGRLLKTAAGNPGSGDRSETAYLYDEARRLVAVKPGGKIQTRYQCDDMERKSDTESSFRDPRGEITNSPGEDHTP
jgi:hypothetical protein